ncbi:MAG: hypothetical protein ABI678_01615 [Kofleriaceae bacterium]
MNPTPRSRGWAVGVLGMIVIFLGMAVSTILDGTYPTGYLGAHWPAGQPWPYPTEAVQFSVVAMAVECATACAFLAARSTLAIGWRAVACAVLFVVPMLFFGAMAMHAPAPTIDHVVFLFFAAVFLVLFAIGSAFAGVVATSRATGRCA